MGAGFTLKDMRQMSAIEVKEHVRLQIADEMEERAIQFFVHDKQDPLVKHIKAQRQRQAMQLMKERSKGWQSQPKK